MNDSFKNIKHRAYKFAMDVIRLMGNLKSEKIWYSIQDQLIRSSTSIGANLVESSGASSRKDLINYLHISLKSANETKYWLCLIRDSYELSKDDFNMLINEADELSKIIAASIISLKAKQL